MGELQQILPAMQADYPCARLSDHVKLIYQNEFGCAPLLCLSNNPFSAAPPGPRAEYRGRPGGGRRRPPPAAAACLNPSATATGAST